MHKARRAVTGLVYLAIKERQKSLLDRCKKTKSAEMTDRHSKLVFSRRAHDRTARRILPKVRCRIPNHQRECVFIQDCTLGIGVGDDDLNLRTIWEGVAILSLAIDEQV